MSRPSSEENKRVYSKPSFVLYGNLPAITKAVAMNSTISDAGTGQTNKTA